jgi:hypothetical protein
MERRREAMAARGEGGWTTRRADATQVTKFLCESFPDASQEQVLKVWEEQRGNVTRCVEVLSELSEAMRRQITVIKVGYPSKFALETRTPNAHAHVHIHAHAHAYTHACTFPKSMRLLSSFL